MLNGLIPTSDTALGLVRRVGDLFKAGTASSLADYVKMTRVEPITVVDRSLLSYEPLEDVMRTLNNLFAGYYLQAISISMSVGNIEINRHLERFNPNRSPKDNLIDGAGTLIAMESQRIIKFKGLDLQARSSRANGDAENETASSIDENYGRHFAELANLSVGKLISVELTDGNHSVKIPISIRLIATESTPNNIVSILSTVNDLKSLKERYEGLVSGRLSFWRDIVAAEDLIQAHRERLAKDTTGVYKNARARASKNLWSSVFSLNPSVATASNIFVMSKTTADQLELASASRLKDFKAREKIFAQMYVLFIAVVDTEWDRITIYTRGIPETNTMSASALKTINKGTGPSVAEILAAYQVGRSPSL